MGIKYFFKWFKSNFSTNIENIKKDSAVNVNIDNLLIDMNGIFHNSAQKIYQYGNFKRMMKVNTRNIDQTLVFRDICQSIEKIMSIVNPKKRVILCVDGPAPLSKQSQQRQRRFTSSINNDNNSFDSNSITPGTKFMDRLTKYIDWYIKLQLSSNSPLWVDLEIIFSNEKAPGEGEHKLFNYIRKFGKNDESYCIHGLDADLIMLSLGINLEKFYLLREEQMGKDYGYYLIDIFGAKNRLIDMMRWEESEVKFDKELCIKDFIFMCFTVGNDFLPHIPAIEIITGGIEQMLDVYKMVCSTYGHLLENLDKGLRFRKESLQIFLGVFSQYERGVFQEKINTKGEYYPDPILEKCVDEQGVLDIKKYRETYYKTNFPKNVSRQHICHSYLEGMQWVISYYTNGVTNWSWRYPYHYAPFSYNLASHVKSFVFPEYDATSPTKPFLQLLSVLPPKSSHLLPFPLSDILKSNTSPLSEYCPEDFIIDLSGKKNAWEGIAILPIIDYSLFENVYEKNQHLIECNDMKRNILGKTFVYKKGDKQYYIKSFYGNFMCNTETKIMDL